MKPPSNLATNSIAQSLAVGGECLLPSIQAAHYWNHTRLFIEPGTYQFEVKSLNDWRDLNIRVPSADGYLSQDAGWPRIGHRMLEKRRRPHDPWFSLIGCLGKNEARSFLIGTRSTHHFSEAGELTCYANDVALRLFFYQKNHGSLQLQVKRLPES